MNCAVTCMMSNNIKIRLTYNPLHTIIISVLLFRQQPVTFTACITSYYHLKLLGILENSIGKRIALLV